MTAQGNTATEQKIVAVLSLSSCAASATVRAFAVLYASIAPPIRTLRNRPGPRQSTPRQPPKTRARTTTGLVHRVYEEGPCRTKRYSAAWVSFDGACGIIAADRIFLTAHSRKFPNRRKGERLEVLAPKTIGLLAIVTLLPFVEASRWNEAAALRVSKQRQFVHRLGTRIDMRDLGLFLHPKKPRASFFASRLTPHVGACSGILAGLADLRS